MTDLKIGDEVYIHGFVDEVRRDTVIIKNEGGYFGTVTEEIIPSAQPEQKIGKFVRWMEKKETPSYISYTPHCECSVCRNELLIECINYCYICGARLIEDREVERWEG